jgi:hypothetical protein
MNKNRWVTTCAALLFSTAACVKEDPLAINNNSLIASREIDPITQDGNVQLLNIGLTAVGSFKPGSPILVTASFGSVVPADIDLSIEALDITDSPTGSRRAASYRDERASPSRSNRTANITFDKPGYYRIVASAVHIGVLPETLKRQRVNESANAEILVLIDSIGGRASMTYDSTVALKRPMVFGPYGPFKATPSLQNPSNNRMSALRMPSSTITMSGYYEYWDLSTDVNAYVRTNDGMVTTTCKGYSTDTAIIPDIEYDVYSQVSSNGQWSATCPEGVAYSWAYADGIIYPEGGYVRVTNSLGHVNPSPFRGYDNDVLTIYAIRNAEAHALTVLETYAPAINAAFNDSRSKITVRVTVAPDTLTPGYQTGNDRIVTDDRNVYNRIGLNTSVHEYAHAFHWGALEPPTSYSCTGWHEYSVANNISCAFVEGFADFVATYILQAHPYFSSGADYIDYEVENQLLGTANSLAGWRIEGAVAGFLYDLVDTSTSPNTWVNTSDGIDDDSAAYSISAIGGIITSCSLDSSTTIDGIDQFIYCAEQSLAPQSLVHPVVNDPYFKLRFLTDFYSSVSVGSHSLSSTAVRAAWKHNLFQQ